MFVEVFGAEEKARCDACLRGTYIMVVTFLWVDAGAHIKPLEKDTGRRNGKLWKFENAAGVQYEVCPLRSRQALLFWRDSVGGRRRIQYLLVGEEPLTRGVRSHFECGDVFVKICICICICI